MMRPLLAAGALAISMHASLHASLASAETPPSIPYEKYRLANGLEVILSQDRTLPLVAVDIWYHVGAANEEPGRTGFAHLFEHMMFTGSKHVPRGVADKLLEGVGGTDSNASTSFDRTNYFDTVPSNQLELALWIHADRMGYLLDSLDQAALSNQQDVVRNERRQSYENRPYGIVDEAVFHALFPPGHPYRPAIIGSHVDIQAAALADVRDFFKRYYRPNNATLTLVGDFDTAVAKRLVQKYFGSFKRGPEVPKPVVVTPALTSEKRLTVSDQIELERLDLAWLTAPKFKPGDAELTIAGYILAGGKSSRLYKKLVYELQVAQEVSAGQDANGLTSIFEIEAIARSGHTAAELQPLIDAELDRLAAEAPTAAEVEAARNQIERSLYQSLQKVGGSNGRADLLNMYNHYTGDPGYLPKDIERYARVTPDDVQRIVRDTLRKDARVVVLAVRGDKKLDPDPPVPEIARNPGTEAINADERWRNATPKGGPTRIPTLPEPHSFALANGLRVLYLQRPNLPIVSAQLVVDAGLAAGDPSLPGVSDFTAAMLEEGTQSRSSQQISDELERLGASYVLQTHRDTTSLEIDALARNFPDALALLADIAQHPAFPADEIERQRKSRLSTIAESREHGGALADVAFARALYGPAHPYGNSAIGTEASVKRIGEADLRSLWQRHFRPDKSALIVVGAIDAASLKALVERQWGGWQPASAAIANTPPAKAVTSTARVIIVDRPGAPQTELRFGRIGTVRTTPDFAALQVLNEAFGGAFSSRLNLDLREDKGYTYGVGSRFSYGRMPAPFVIRTAVRSDVSAPAVKEVFSELKRVTAAPLAADELKRARGSLTQSLPGSFETNEATAGSFGDLFAYGLPLDYYRKLPVEFNAVKAPTLEALARRYLDPAGMVVVAVGDRKNLESGLQPLNLGPLEVWPITGTLF
ncbi:MAG TPA: pitrilysin family protein [Casimicrobiaceae bacterium]|nr:pitrilysin family protein [Casimicrobiaceae bacterium]